MAEDAAPGFVQHQGPQPAVGGDEAGLRPTACLPGGGATPPTITSPTSPSAWQPIT